MKEDEEGLTQSADHRKIEVYVLPHLPVENNFKGIVTGMENESLPEKSIGLAKLVPIDFLLPLEIVAHSGMNRARETIESIFLECDFEEIVDDRLMPTNYGSYHGCMKSEVRADRLKYITRPFPTGESYLHMSQRIRSFLSSVSKRNPRKVLIIGHESTSAIIDHLLTPKPLHEALCFDDECAERLKKEGATQEQIVSQPPIGPFYI